MPGAAAHRKHIHKHINKHTPSPHLRTPLPRGLPCWCSTRFPVVGCPSVQIEIEKPLSDPVIITGEMTRLSQPLNAAVSKSTKNSMRRTWSNPW